MDKYVCIGEPGIVETTGKMSVRVKSSKNIVLRGDETQYIEIVAKNIGEHPITIKKLRMKQGSINMQATIMFPAKYVVLEAGETKEFFVEVKYLGTSKKDMLH
jgi:hypothetical protein